jgi:dolichol-phosphate mannosyltransferase
MKRLITIIIPVFNNADSLIELSQRILFLSRKENSFEFEIIFVDDGSLDESWTTLTAIKSSQEFNVNSKLVKLVKNYGQMAAILAGMQSMTGEGAVILSADLQDAPEQVSDFLRKIESGASFIIAERTVRLDSFGTRLSSSAAYFFIRKKYSNFPKGGFDFYYVSKEICSQLLKLKGRYRYLQPELMSLGFRPVYVESVRNVRKYGESQHSIAKRIDYFLTAMLDFSPMFLRKLSLFGFLGMFIAISLTGIAIYQRIFGQVPFSGFTTMFLLIVFVSSLQIAILSIIGEYVWRTFDSSRSKPYFVVDTII